MIVNILNIALPLACGLAFPLGAWLLKRGMEEARDPWGVLIVANGCMLLPYLAVFALPGSPGLPGREALLCGALFFAGQVAATRSFQAGDLSVAIPLQGIKVLLVALLIWIFLGQPAGWNVWAAALLSLAALYFLSGHGAGKREAARYRTTAWLALAAASAFAGVDVALQAWASGDMLRFGFRAFFFQALLSVGLFFLPGRKKRFRYPARAWRPLLAGSAVMSVISFGLTWVITAGGHAARVNILFNSRVLWSVVIVALFGRWMQAREASGPGARRLLAGRLLGAVLMMAAIVLAVL